MAIVALTLLLASAAASAEGTLVWETGNYTPADWSASTANLLSSAGVAGESMSFYTESGKAMTQDLAAFADGVVPGSTCDYTKIVGVKGGNVCWTLRNKVILDSISIYTRWVNGGRDGIAISSVQVRRNGSLVWEDLVAPSLSYGTGDNTTSGALYAKLTRSDGDPLATDIAGIKICFSSEQDNNGAGYVEIEACGSVVGRADPIPYDGQTMDGDYTISTAAQLSQLANNLPNGGFYHSTFTLQNDIDFSSELSGWGRPIGVVKGFDVWSNPAVPFRGTFDGCGHIIRNLNVSCTKSSGWGLFGYVSGADIRNLTVEGTMSGLSCSTAGLLVGKVDADTSISNCTVRAEVAGRPGSSGIEVGTMIGCVSGANCQIVDCSASGTVGGYSCGGFVGQVTAASVFRRCQADSNVTATNMAAAFVEKAQSGPRFEDCQAKGSAESLSEAGAAGFVGTGQLSATFVRCAAFGDVVANYRGGGFVCDSGAASYTNCTATGNVTVHSAAYRYGYAENAAGGFAGILILNGAEFIRCSADGNVLSKVSSRVGGFLGNGYNAGGTFRQCRASGRCEGQNTVGGFFGCIRFASTNDQCFALGDVISRAENAGGFVGSASKLYSFNSYSSGSVEGTTSVGGFVGYGEFGAFTNCYATGRYQCSDPGNDGYYDGFLGSSSYVTETPIGSCFALENRLARAGVTVLTDAQFLEPGYFSGWPVDVWWLPSVSGVSRPQLAWSYAGEGTVVPSSITGGRDVAIPNAWFAGYPEFETKYGSDKATAAVKPTGKKTADGSTLSVWQDYITGTDPTDSDSVFSASIEMVDGVPSVSWSPYLNSNGTERVYRVLGKNNLADKEEGWLAARATNHFFKVTVQMPNGVDISDSPGLISVEQGSND